MNCGNLRAVAHALRTKWPTREITIAADNDAWTDGRNQINGVYQQDVEFNKRRF